MLHWWKYKRQLSAYRDHSLPASQFRMLWTHLYHCISCRERLDDFDHLGNALKGIARPALPKDLVLQVRVRLSQERAERERPGWVWALAERWRFMALPGAAGLLSAILIFGIFASHFTLPLRAAASPDVPLDVRTPARLRDGRLLEMDTKIGDMTVQLLIDAQGRVADYDIVSGTYTAEDVRNLRNSLLFAVFDPATLFGMPTSGTLVLSYQKLNIRG